MPEVVPSRDEPAPVPFIDLKAQYETIQSEIQEAVERVLASQCFILGDEVSELECDVAEYCDSRDAIGCASGSDSLLLSFMALGIGPGDEVITSPFSFFATAGSIVRCGATPVFVDIDPETYNIDPAAIEAAISPKTRAIMPVHLFGQCADMDPIWRLAVRHGLVVVEDACQAIGARYRGRRAGVLGTTGCFSFFPTKNLGAYGDAGIVTTDDPEVSMRLRRLRVHGDAGGYVHTESGINSRLDALQAAILKVKLAHLDKWHAARQQNAARYMDLATAIGLDEVIGLPVARAECDHVFNQFTVRIPDGQRGEVMQSLRSQGIGCTIYYPIALHLQQCFEHLGYQPGQLPHAERAAAEVLSLPIFPELTAVQQEHVISALATAVNLDRSRDTIPYPFQMPDSRAA